MPLLSRALLLGIVLALGACSLSRPAVQPATYYLSVTRDAPAVSALQPVALRVRPLRAAPMYERRDFIYRVDGERVVSDFYSVFAESPDAMITAALTSWLKDARVFKAVIEPGVAVDAPYTLEGTIVALYGDFRDPAKPEAVLGIQFYLMRSGPGGREIVLDRALEERVPFSARTPEALVHGYDDALGRILSALERELAGLNLDH